MKTCLITGGGSKFGGHVTNQLLKAGFHVYLVTSNPEWKNQKNLSVIPVDWKNINLSDLKTIVPDTAVLDLVFFNHNASALSQTAFAHNSLTNMKHWQHSYFVACQLPFYLVHFLSKKLTVHSKVAWMLTQLIFDPNIEQIAFADYVGNKFTNYCIMKNFAINHQASFFGLHPDGGLGCELDYDVKAKHMIDFIESTSATDLNGKVFTTQGQPCDFWSKDLTKNS